MPRNIRVQLDDPGEPDECEACGKVIPGWTTKCPFCGAIQSEDFDKDLDTLERNAKTNLKAQKNAGGRGPGAGAREDGSRVTHRFASVHAPLRADKPVGPLPQDLPVRAFAASILLALSILVWFFTDNVIFAIVLILVSAFVFLGLPSLEP